MLNLLFDAILETINQEITIYSLISLAMLIYITYGFIKFFISFFVKVYNKIDYAKNKIPIQATITKIAQDFETKNIHGQNPYVIYCSYNDYENNKKYYFKSAPLYTDPTNNLDNTINVYVNPNNYNDYEVDLSSIPGEHNNKKLSKFFTFVLLFCLILFIFIEIISALD